MPSGCMAALGSGNLHLPNHFRRISRRLAASFFFFRSDPRRNDGRLLIPTLVSHLVLTFQGNDHFVEDRIRERPAVFTKRCETQIQIEPLLALRRPRYPTPLFRPRWCANTQINFQGTYECPCPSGSAQIGNTPGSPS